MMRKLCIVFFTLLLLMSACGKNPDNQKQLLVNIRETTGFTVENNGQYVQPGEDAVFLLRIEEGLSVSGADYDGDYHAVLEDGKMKLTLKNVRYPSHVDLRLTDSYVTVTYKPNGAMGESVTHVYDTTYHLRPNTSTGDGLFTRDGYTLVSWNTRPDGTGQRIGLGSRTDVPQDALTLYAQWEKWSAAQDFIFTVRDDTVAITGYRGNDATIVIPASIEGKTVTEIASGAFESCAATQVIFPQSVKKVEEGAFRNCALESLVLFDNIEVISDGSFADCKELKTLRINAVEKPYGYNYRKESVYADKVDLLIQAQGKKKIVFYGGCSMWFNLDSTQLTPLLEQGYQVINMGLNGMANSFVQMQIIEAFLEPGDIFFHTPEISSAQQMMIRQTMDNDNGDKLWCGLEYNYDLFTLVDMRTVPGVLSSLRDYLDIKESGTDYVSTYIRDGNVYCDDYGCIPFYRDETYPALQDEVHMDPSYITDAGMARLKEYYDRYQSNGVRIYVSYACTNMDEVIDEEKNNVEMVAWRFRKAIETMEGPVVISALEDYLYHRNDFYDTNYHLLSEPARKNTILWLRDLQTQMEQDGLWEAP